MKIAAKLKIIDADTGKELSDNIIVFPYGKMKKHPFSNITHLFIFEYEEHYKEVETDDK